VIFQKIFKKIIVKKNQTEIKNSETKQLFLESGLFDELYYMNHYDDVKISNLSPIEHFLEVGLSQYRNPNSEFDVQWYYDSNNDIQNSGMNPIVHYIKYGKNENRETNKKPKIESNFAEIDNNKLLLLGEITEYTNGYIHGWYYCNYNILPIIYIDGKLCKIIKSNLKLPQIAKQYNFDRENIGFVAKAKTNLRDANNIELYAVFQDCAKKITSTNKFYINNLVPEGLSMLLRLKEISNKNNAVLITIWDITHNPLGRAKVLYDILKKANRPVFIVGFDFGFGDGVWGPLSNSNIELLSIKWDEKELFKQVVKSLDIYFETIWICKPRLPSYILADLFSNKSTNLILDIDDNEEVLSAIDEAKYQPYGELSNYLCKSITKNIEAKSVASISLKEKYGGEFVRHARDIIQTNNPHKEKNSKSSINLGFFGTIRPFFYLFHQNLIKKLYEFFKAIGYFILGKIEC
jgi:hypothetical protein